MSELMDDVAYLSQEIGPRPAGTEEEQQAAIYISDAFKKRTGLSTQVEDFACNSKPEIINVVLCALPIILSIIAMIKNIVAIPAILVGIICALFFVLEIIDKPLLSKAFARGISQNVVAKYVPATQAGKRTRKVVVVTNYDSGKVRKDYGSVTLFAIMQKASAAAIVAIPVIWILRAIFAMSATGVTAIVWNVITIIALILAAIPIVLFILHQTAEYNEAANCNASSVAVMLEVANRIAHTPVVLPEEETVVHGEAAAREEGLIPEGAQVEYEVAPTAAPEEVAIQEGEIAVAEIASEQPAPSAAMPAAESLKEQAQDEEAGQNFVFFDDEYGWPEEFAFQAGQDYSAFEEPAPAVPEWYAKAQANVGKPQPATAPVRRSRFASALDDAVATSQAHYQAVNEAAAAERAATMATASAVAKTFRRPAEPNLPTWPAASALEEAEEAQDVCEEIIAGSEEAESSQVQPAPEEQMACDSAASDQEATIDGPDTEATSEPAAEVLPEAEEELDPFTAALRAAQAFSAQRGEPIEEIPVQVQEEPMEEARQCAEPAVDPGSTTEMAPIDVSELRAIAQRARQKREEAKATPAAESDNDDVASAEELAAPAVESEASAEPERILVEDPEVRMDLPMVELQQQRAPLAEMVPDPSLSAQIPRVDLEAFGVSTAGNAETMDNKRAALRNMLPSMSGSITLEASIDEPEEPSTVSRTGSFAPVGLSGSIGPVGDELIEGVDPEDIYVDDADDSSYETTMTETGAYAGPGYMEMPESLGSRIFGRFRKKKDKKENQSAQEWLGVEDDFNPTQAGAERGSWESFNEENRDKYRSRRDEDLFDDDLWNGGAFSKVRAAASNLTKKASAEDKASEPKAAEEPRSRRRKVDTTLPLADIITPEVVEEVKKVEDFHLKNVDIEVWFVALGSENAANGGTKAFFAEHADELRGAMIINLEGIGAGSFTQVGTEGLFKSKTASPRLKRFIKKAQQVSGVTFTNGKMCWKDSIASIALRRGMKAATLAGMENGKPAYIGQGDDVLENVEEETMIRRTEFIEAMIRHM